MDQSFADRLTSGVKSLFRKESSLGMLLLISIATALLWANSPWKESYFGLWDQQLTIGVEGYSITASLHLWINDGLMAYFFLLIGLEIRREFLSGALSGAGRAALPLFAALGGILFPAFIYLAFNAGTEGAAGWGIPMATDIALSVGLLTLAGRFVARSSRTFLTAMATADDIVAILVIAFFLSAEIDTRSLLAGGFYFLLMLGGNFLGVRSFWFYFVIGTLGLWVALLLSGIHATLAGVLAAFTIPANTRITGKAYQEHLLQHTRAFDQARPRQDRLLSQDEVEAIQQIIQASKQALTPLQRVEENIRPFVHYGVLPLFALANAGVPLQGAWDNLFTHPVSLGILLGLVAGKAGGIFVMARAAAASGLGQLPKETSWRQVLGQGLMAGIGFTMSLFIAELALEDEALLRIAKIAVLTGSALSACLGLLWFRLFSRKKGDGAAPGPTPPET
jgi:NhaA family Na+:H+ antiporter